MTKATTEYTAPIAALERSIPGMPPAVVLTLIGDMARLQALLWTRLSTATLDEDGVEDKVEVLGPEWLSVETVATRYGLDKRWLGEHRQDLRRRNIISKPSRKTTLYHARRLARFLEERSRP